MGDNHIIIEIIILINIFLLVNVFVLYPVLISLIAKFFKKPIQISEDYQPEISIIIAAYNEEELIKDAIVSIYKSGYPIELINVIVGSDGSTDATIEILKGLKDEYPSIQYYEYERSGKNYVLNQLVPKANTELIYYMDADLRIQKGALRKSVNCFADDEIGAVLSALSIIGENIKSNAGGIGETLYQKYEFFIRSQESRIFSSINSLGTLYGIRKEFYVPIPNDLVCDDLFSLLNTGLSKKRIIFLENSVVDEVREKSTNEELVRKIRLVAGGLSTVSTCRKILSPKYGWVAFFVWNHKLLRWFSPLYLILIAVGTLLLSSESVLFESLLIGQIVLYFGAFLGWLLEKYEIGFLPLKILLFIVSMNIGFLFGIIRFMFGGQNARWERSF